MYVKNSSKFLCFAVTPFLLIGVLAQNFPLKILKKETSLVSIEFDNVVGSEDLLLNTGNYSNIAGEKFTVSQLQYFISNIKLRRTDGEMYILDQDKSYFLIQENNPLSHVIKLEIPVADYNQISFVLGVDSVRNTMDIDKRTGVLDPASSLDNGMYWGWNSGYIFLKMEGISSAAPVDPTGQQKFRYHIGGFGGYSGRTINNIKAISLNFPQHSILKLHKEGKAKILVKADILKIFNGAVKVSIASHSNVMFSEYSVNIANNYSSMFTCDQIEN